MATDSVVAGPNIVLMGPAGTGKTHSIGTLVEAGVETFYLGLEPGLESLLGYFSDKGKEVPANLHWHNIAPAKTSFTTLKKNAENVNRLTYESLTKLQDPDRQNHNLFVKIMEAMCDFPDDRTGTRFGPVDEWKPERALVIDGLTGLGRAAMSLVIGGKPVKSQTDWGVAQDQVETFLRMLCDQCKCTFILIAHVERETDQVLGGIKVTVSSLGKALPAKIPQMFSDVILAERANTTWTWNTASPQADVKTRNLEWKSSLPPSFAPIITKWKTRVAAASAPAKP